MDHIVLQKNNICEVNTVEQFLQLEVPWRWLESQKQVPDGFGFDRVKLWLECFFYSKNFDRFGQDRMLKILYFVSNEQIVAILPLQIVKYKKKLFTYRRLEFLTQSFGGTFFDLILDKNFLFDQCRVIKNMFEYIKKNFNFDVIHLAYLKDDSLLKSFFYENSYLHSVVPYIKLHQSYEETRSNEYSKNLRHVLNKSRNRIQKLDLHLAIEITEDKDIMHRNFEKIKLTARTKMSQSGKHSHYEDQDISTYLFKYFIGFKRVFLATIFDEDKLLAYNIGVIKDGCVCALDATYSRDFQHAEKIGLGLILYDRLVEKYSGGFECVDMGHGFDDYKFRFTKKINPTYQVILSGNRSIFGVIISRLTLNSTKKQVSTIEGLLKKYELS